MNALERSVIEVARDLFRRDAALPPVLMDAICALNEHEQALTAAGLTETPWAQVTAGDQIQGRSGALYPVVATKREWKMGKPTGKFVIIIDWHGRRKEIIRPSEAQPEATVKRGDAGAAVDMFVTVFESGES